MSLKQALKDSPYLFQDEDDLDEMSSPLDDFGTTEEACSSKQSSISPRALKHLQAAVSCGYGLFHLAISLVPPKLLRFCHLLGFSGNREVGLQALDLASQSEDMKAPVARCVSILLCSKQTNKQTNKQTKQGAWGKLTIAANFQVAFRLFFKARPNAKPFKIRFIHMHILVHLHVNKT